MEQKIKYGVNNEYIVKILSSNITDRLKRAHKNYMKNLKEKKNNKGKKNYNHAESNLIDNCINSFIERLSMLCIYILGWRMSEENKEQYQDLIYRYFQQALLGRDNMKSVCSLDERIFFFNNHYIILEISILALATNPDFRQQHDFLVSQQIDIDIVSLINIFDMMDTQTMTEIVYLEYMLNKINTLIIENKPLFNIQEKENSVLIFMGNEKFDAIRDAIRLSGTLYHFWNYVYNDIVSKKEINESKNNLDKYTERNINLQNKIIELEKRSTIKKNEYKPKIKPLRYSTKITPEVLLKCVELRNNTSDSATNIMRNVSQEFSNNSRNKQFSYQTLRKWLDINGEFLPKFKSLSEFKIISLMNEKDIEEWFEVLAKNDKRFEHIFKKYYK